MESILSLGLLGVASYTDWKEFKIYNKHVLAGILAGVLYNIYLSGYFGLKISLFGLAAGIFLLLPAWFMGAVGAGDVKLFGALGSITGVSFLLKICPWLVLFCFVYSFSLLIYKRQLLSALKWIWEYINYVFLRVITLGFKEIQPPILEKKTPVKFALIIAASALAVMII